MKPSDTAQFIDSLLTYAGFGLMAAALTAGPWLFGAWEMWWFWPLATCLIVSTGCFAFRLLLGTCPQPGRPIRPAHLYLLLSAVPFLAYGLVRAAQTYVFMDAERSYLLFLLPVLVGAQVLFGLPRRLCRALYLLIFINLVLLGCYGLINHVVTGNRLVMWAEGYPQYFEQNRATGSYFCPDHFAGIMEILLALSLGIVLSRAVKSRYRWAAAITALVGVVGVVLSKSRGGGLTVLVMLGFTLAAGFSQWPRRVRWQLRGAAIGVLVVAVGIFAVAGKPYLVRFTSYFEVQNRREMSLTEWRAALTQRLLTTSRGRMYPAALRAWRSAPLLGIGPGMHQTVWPHVAPTPDGDRLRGIWPSQINTGFHSYEVHNDWLQLLEEYGLVGLLLVLVPAGLLTALLGLRLRRQRKRIDAGEAPETGAGMHPVVLGGLLALLAMAFHSLGDFNLQMPATGWLFAALLGIALRLE